MLRFIRYLTVCAVLVAVLGSVSSAHAASPAVDFVNTRQFLVLSLLGLRPSEQRDRQVSAILDRMFAYDQMAKLTLPDHWDDLSEGQHQEYTALLKRLFQRHYEETVARILYHRLEFTSEDGEHDDVTVHVKATSGRVRLDRDGHVLDEVPTVLDYDLIPSGAGFKVVDLGAGGSSFVKQYKNKCQPIYEKDGFDVLLKQMKVALGLPT
jgi:ABC-type transporter MlaC component